MKMLILNEQDGKVQHIWSDANPTAAEERDAEITKQLLRLEQMQDDAVAACLMQALFHYMNGRTNNG